MALNTDRHCSIPKKMLFWSTVRMYHGTSAPELSSSSSPCRVAAFLSQKDMFRIIFLTRSTFWATPTASPKS
eukprot:CAMPEP_0173466712 /NCGR_PEP_ID=MMETSP1357-20121228/73815_1 /TAXON_ID=77926 /ORGANISM="Hemiselmis rufescens, Strain PCC563" /LENGTH=71 /DNA_ID=CAMNT_0014434789 /DNA_START=82 /DNA_END=293 /DNA_ORIENTATION=-